MYKPALVCAAIVLAIAACTPSEDTSRGAGETVSADTVLQIHPDVLRKNANELAQREFERLAAAELIYRHTVIRHEVANPVTNEKNIALNKMYREITHAEVEDVYRSESYLYPVTVKIRFDYDLFSTSARPLGNAESLELAEADTAFTLKDQYSTYRWYRCDGEANHIGNLPPLLPRPSLENIRYFDHEQGAGLLNPYPPGNPPKTYPRRILRPFN